VRRAVSDEDTNMQSLQCFFEAQAYIVEGKTVSSERSTEACSFYVLPASLENPDTGPLRWEHAEHLRRLLDGMPT